MGGRGAGSSVRYNGGGLDPNDILSTRSMISAREENSVIVDEALNVFRDVQKEYGYIINDIELARLKAGSSAMAYYDGSNIALNEAYFDKKASKKHTVNR